MPFYDLRCPKCDKEYNISASSLRKPKSASLARTAAPSSLRPCSRAPRPTLKAGRAARARIGTFAGRGAAMGDEAAFGKDELEEAHRALLSTLRKCEKMDAEKLGMSQRTLLERRIAALKVAMVLIEKESRSEE